MYDDRGQILLAAPFLFKNIEKPVEPTDIKKIFEQNNYTNLYLQQLGDYFEKTPNIVSEQPKSKIETPLFKPFQLNPQIKSDFQNRRVDLLKKVEQHIHQLQNSQLQTTTILKTPQQSSSSK